MLRKTISVMLAVIITFGVLPVIPAQASAYAATADGSESVGLSTDNIEVSGSNSLGSMLAEEYEKNAENLEDTGSGIYAVEVEGKTARVDVRALVEAQLIVSVFDEEGNNMYGSGMTDVSTEDTIVELTFEIDTMPQYFYIKAFLLDKATNLPLCRQFENNYYTQKMQEFFAKSTDDFDEDKVLNLDNSRQDNFLVYNDDTIIIDNDDQNTNIVTKADDESKEYIIENIDGKISALKSGDIFSYDFGDGLLIIKINTITINGTTATINGDEMALQEAFDYIKIDAKQGSDNANFDPSGLGDNVEYLGEFADDSEKAGEPAGLTLANIDATVGTEFSYKFFENKEDWIEGTLGVKLEAEIRIYYDAHFLQESKIEFSAVIKYELSAKLKVELKGKIPHEFSLGFYLFSPVPGVEISVTPAVILEGKVSFSTTIKITGQIGFGFENWQPVDKTKAPVFESTIKFEGEVFFGFSLIPEIRIIGDVASAEFEGKVGVKIKGTLTEWESGLIDNKDEQHLCQQCIEGEISAALKLQFKFSLMNNPDLTWSYDFFDLEWKMCDFYWSFDHGEFAFTKCPHYTYKQTVFVLDKNKKPIEGVTVLSEDIDEVTTDSKGRVSFFAKHGNLKLTFKKDGKEVVRERFVDHAGKLTFVIDFDKPENDLNDSGKLVKSYRKVIQAGLCGYNVFYALYDDGLLVITGKGRMYNYTYSPWYDNRNKVKKAVIGNSVENICDNEFYGCTELTSVTIGNSVNFIAGNAFADCTGLTSVIIPDSVTAIGVCAFSNCSGLTSVTIGNGLKSIGGSTFSNCSGLTSVTFGNGVKLIGHGTFMNCTGLTSITIPDAFRNCEKLSSVIIPDSVTSMGDWVFCGCSGLTSVTIPNSVTSIGEGAFYGCTGLTSVNIPDSVTSISPKEFYGCTGLTSVTIPNSVTGIGSSAFYGCTGLTSVTIPDSVTSIGYEAFRDCTGLTSVTIPNSVTGIGSSAFYGCTGLTSVTIPYGVTSIGNDTFSFCTGLTSLTIPDSVTSIGGFAFYGCKNLKDIYYGGNEEDWNKIVGTNSSSLSNVTIHYNSSAPASVGCAPPAEDGAEECVSAIENAAQPKAQQKANTVPVGADDEEPNCFSRSHLVPETEAVLMIVQGTEDTAVLSTASLLYIAQATVDDSGTISFDVQQDFSDYNWVAFIFGECDHSSSEWFVSKEAAADEDGLQTLVCDYCGTVLDTETIDALSANVIYGDVDGDGAVNAKDRITLTRHLARWTDYANINTDNADVTGDGTVNAKDRITLTRYLAKWADYQTLPKKD